MKTMKTLMVSKISRPFVKGRSGACPATCIFCQTGRCKGLSVVTPAEAGVQKSLERLDSRLRGNDRITALSTWQY
jgi:hypothetical protein